MKKPKFFITLILVFCVLILSFGVGIKCYADENADQFVDIVLSLREAYGDGENDILTAHFFGLLNSGENLISQDVIETMPEVIDEFYFYKLEYFKRKTSFQISQSVNADIFCVFYTSPIYFYEEQWGGVENIVNEYLSKVDNAKTVNELDVIDEYFSKILELENREQVDNKLSSLLENAVKSIDLAILKKLNTYLEGCGLAKISEESIASYYKNNTTYDEWFDEFLAQGYTTVSALNVARIHSDAIKKLLEKETTVELNNLDKLADEYQTIANECIAELVKIEPDLVQNNYVLDASKDNAFQVLDSYFADEVYLSADKKTQKQFDEIIKTAKERIENATTVSQVQSVLFNAQNDLAEIDVGGKKWVTPLAVGITLVVLALVSIVVFAIKKKQNLTPNDDYIEINGSTFVDEEKERNDDKKDEFTYVSENFEPQENSPCDMQDTDTQGIEQIDTNTQNNTDITN